MPNLPPVRIVLVDDDDSFRESLGLNLVDEGFDVLSFSSGEPALDYFQRGGEADVILLDWRMPGITKKRRSKAAPSTSSTSRAGSPSC
jgi:two-component system response regulator ChvI